MSRRAPYRHAGILDAMSALQGKVNEAGIDPKIAELCKMRASQLNGCAYCLGMHSYEARQQGETEERLHLVAAWREAPVYSPAERAALALTEAMTLLPGSHGVPDDVWDEAEAQLGKEQAGALVWLVIAINAWNRLQVTAKAEPTHWRDAAAVAAST